MAVSFIWQYIGTIFYQMTIAAVAQPDSLCNSYGCIILKKTRITGSQLMEIRSNNSTQTV